MELPGSFSGSISSPRPHLGPDPNNRISFAILKRLTATVFKVPENSTRASWAARASNLFGAVINGKSVILEIFFATDLSHPCFVFSPVPTAVPPWANS